MRYNIGNYQIPTNQITGKAKRDKRKIKEYYITDDSGNVVAGDFRNYMEAKSYLSKQLLKHTR